MRHACRTSSSPRALAPGGAVAGGHPSSLAAQAAHPHVAHAVCSGVGPKGAIHTVGAACGQRRGERVRSMDVGATAAVQAAEQQPRQCSGVQASRSGAGGAPAMSCPHGRQPPCLYRKLQLQLPMHHLRRGVGGRGVQAGWPSCTWPVPAVPQRAAAAQLCTALRIQPCERHSLAAAAARVSLLARLRVRTVWWACREGGVCLAGLRR